MPNTPSKMAPVLGFVPQFFARRFLRRLRPAASTNTKAEHGFEQTHLRITEDKAADLGENKNATSNAVADDKAAGNMCMDYESMPEKSASDKIAYNETPVTEPCKAFTSDQLFSNGTELPSRRPSALQLPETPQKPARPPSCKNELRQNLPLKNIKVTYVGSIRPPEACMREPSATNSPKVPMPTTPVKAYESSNGSTPESGSKSSVFSSSTSKTSTSSTGELWKPRFGHVREGAVDYTVEFPGRQNSPPATQRQFVYVHKRDQSDSNTSTPVTAVLLTAKPRVGHVREEAKDDSDFRRRNPDEPVMTEPRRGQVRKGAEDQGDFFGRYSLFTGPNFESPDEKLGIDRYRTPSHMSREERMRHILNRAGDLFEVSARLIMYDLDRPDATFPGHPDITYAELLSLKKAPIPRSEEGGTPVPVTVYKWKKGRQGLKSRKTTVYSTPEVQRGFPKHIAPNTSLSNTIVTHSSRPEVNTSTDTSNNSRLAFPVPRLVHESGLGVFRIDARTKREPGSKPCEMPFLIGDEANRWDPQARAFPEVPPGHELRFNPEAERGLMIGRIPNHPRWRKRRTDYDFAELYAPGRGVQIRPGGRPAKVNYLAEAGNV